MQKIEGGKQSQSQDGDDGMEVNEEMASKPEPEQQQSMEKWSLYCCLTPLAVNLLETKPVSNWLLFYEHSVGKSKALSNASFQRS